MLTLDNILTRLRAGGVEIVCPEAARTKRKRASLATGSATVAAGSESEKRAQCAVASRVMATGGTVAEAALASGLDAVKCEAIKARYAAGWRAGSGTDASPAALDESCAWAVGVRSYSREWQSRSELWAHAAHSVAAVWQRGGSVSDAVAWFASAPEVAALRTAAKKDFGPDYQQETRTWFSRLFALYVIAPASSLARHHGKTLTLRGSETAALEAAWGSDWVPRLAVESRIFDGAWAAAVPGEIVRPAVKRKTFFAAGRKIATWLRRGKTSFTSAEIIAALGEPISPRHAARLLSALPGLTAPAGGHGAAWQIQETFPAALMLSLGEWTTKKPKTEKKDTVKKETETRSWALPAPTLPGLDLANAKLSKPRRANTLKAALASVEDPGAGWQKKTLEQARPLTLRAATAADTAANPELKIGDWMLTGKSERGEKGAGLLLQAAGAIIAQPVGFRTGESGADRREWCAYELLVKIPPEAALPPSKRFQESWVVVTWFPPGSLRKSELSRELDAMLAGTYPGAVLRIESGCKSFFNADGDEIFYAGFAHALDLPNDETAWAEAAEIWKARTERRRAAQKASAAQWQERQEAYA